MICNKCHEEKPLQFFYREKRSKIGYRKVCKACNLLDKKARIEKEAAAGRIILEQFLKTHDCDIGYRKHAKKFVYKSFNPPFMLEDSCIRNLVQSAYIKLEEEPKDLILTDIFLSSPRYN